MDKTIEVLKPTQRIPQWFVKLFNFVELGLSLLLWIASNLAWDLVKTGWGMLMRWWRKPTTVTAQGSASGQATVSGIS